MLPISIGPVAATLGELWRPNDIEGFDERWERETSGADPNLMGVGTFSRFDEPLAACIVRSIHAALEAAAVVADEVRHLVFSTMDRGLGRLDEDLGATVIHGAGLTRCVPVLISYQRCCSSLAALRYASSAVRTGDCALIVAFDHVSDDLDRVRPFAFFGDAVTSCVVRAGEGPVIVHAVEVGVDYAGLVGGDTFASRQAVARSTLRHLTPAASNGGLAGRPVFSTNLFRPVAMFNATVAGLKHDDLRCETTRARYGHCGNCDWMLNLAEYCEPGLVSDGQPCLLHASAPGFYGVADITVI